MRFPVILLTAALMGWLGLILMYLGTPVFPMLDDFWTQCVVLASIGIWVPASFFLRERKLRTWTIFGAISPLLGALLVAPPASFAFVIMKGYIAVPVGLMTGLILHWVVCTKVCHNKAMHPSDGGSDSCNRESAPAAG